MSDGRPVLDERDPEAKDAPTKPRVAPPTVEDIIARIRRTIAVAPSSSAIHREDRVIDYASLAGAVNRCAAALAHTQAVPGQPVLLSFADRALFVPALIACFEQGYPVLPLDPRLPPARIRDMLHRVPVTATLLDAGGATAAAWASRPHVELAATIFAPAAFGTSPTGGSGLAPGALSTVFFTSGSTGFPKPIAGRLLGVSAFVDWEIDALDGCGPLRVAQLTSAAFDGFLKDVFVPLASGGTICMPNNPDLALQPTALANWLANANVNVLHLVPTTCRKLLGAIRPGQLASIEAVVLAGEPVRPNDVTRLFDMFGENVRLYNLYGPTETTLTKTFHRLTRADATATSVPIGRPMPGVAVRIVDDDGGIAPSGKQGEIVLVTELGSLGYIGDAESTARRFVTDPLGTGTPAYFTGDVGRINPAGLLEFVGRRDNQVKVRGVRMEPNEIEAVMVRHPAVAHAAVITEPDPDGEQRLACYCELRGPAGATILLEHAAEFLPRWMLPSRIVIVPQLPQTANGKLDRVALDGWDEMPTASTGTPTAAPDAPEGRLARIFAAVLGVDSVDLNTSFFALGGHSLLALELVVMIEAKLGTTLTLRDLFEHSSVAALCAHLANLEGGANAS